MGCSLLDGLGYRSLVPFHALIILRVSVSFNLWYELLFGYASVKAVFLPFEECCSYHVKQLTWIFCCLCQNRSAAFGAANQYSV